jgi:hypothetical protein
MKKLYNLSFLIYSIRQIFSVIIYKIPKLLYYYIINIVEKRGLTMENCLDSTDLHYKNVEEYKLDTDKVIKAMIDRSERIVFAEVAEKAGVTRFVVRRYPELRNYILSRIVYYKEIQVIDNKIDKAVNSLNKANKALTFMSIVEKCKFSSEAVYKNEYIKCKIVAVLQQKKK